jgi:Protein of unknown function (DUF2917)
MSKQTHSTASWRLMMNSQFQLFHGGTFRMDWGQPMRIDSGSGELGVLGGRVWLTRGGELEDHVLDAGQRIVLGPTDSVVVEQWQRDQPAIVDWQPRHQPAPLMGLLRGVAARALRMVAFGARGAATGLREAEAGFAALARSAAAMARRAQGCI